MRAFSITSSLFLNKKNTQALINEFDFYLSLFKYFNHTYFKILLCNSLGLNSPFCFIF